MNLTRYDRVNDKKIALEMWVKRWRDAALLSIGDKAKEALVMIRKITHECEEIE